MHSSGSMDDNQYIRPPEYHEYAFAWSQIPRLSDTRFMTRALPSMRWSPRYYSANSFEHLTEWRDVEAWEELYATNIPPARRGTAGHAITLVVRDLDGRTLLDKLQAQEFWSSDPHLRERWVDMDLLQRSRIGVGYSPLPGLIRLIGKGLLIPTPVVSTLNRQEAESAKHTLILLNRNKGKFFYKHNQMTRKYHWTQHLALAEGKALDGGGWYNAWNTLQNNSKRQILPGVGIVTLKRYRYVAENNTL